MPIHTTIHHTLYAFYAFPYSTLFIICRYCNNNHCMNAKLVYYLNISPKSIAYVINKNSVSNLFDRLIFFKPSIAASIVQESSLKACCAHCNITFSFSAILNKFFSAAINMLFVIRNKLIVTEGRHGVIVNAIILWVYTTMITKINTFNIIVIHK